MREKEIKKINENGIMCSEREEMRKIKINILLQLW